MVSGRLSLPQSFSSSPFPALGTAKGAAAPASGQARETPDFRSQFAPATQDLRSRRGGSTPPADGGKRIGPGTQEATGVKNAAEHGKGVSGSGDGSVQEWSDSAQKLARDGGAKPGDESPTSGREDASGAPVKQDEQAGAENDQPVRKTGRDDVHRDDTGRDQAVTGVVADDANSAGFVGAERTGALASDDAEVAGERYQREFGGAVRSDKAKDGAERRVTEAPAQPVDSDETAALKASTQAKQGEVPAAASGAAPVREHAEGQRPASVPAGGSDGEADGTEKVDAGARRQDGGDTGAGEDGEPELARRDVPQQQHAAGRDEGVSASLQGPREGEPAASSRDERAAGRDADARVESQRAESESGTPRREGAPLEAPSPVKLSGPSIADRLAPGGTGDAGRASSLQARVDADGQTSQAVVRGLNAVLRQGGGSLTMKLSPASLGEVRIEMSMQGGRVSVQFDVGNIAAYEAIKGHITELRQSLEQRGMTVERVDTHVSPALAKSAQPDGQSNQRGGEQAGQNGQQDRHDAADGQSRGRADGGDRGGDGSAWESDGSDGAETDFEQSLRLGLDAVA